MNCTGISYAIKKLNLPLFICTKDFHTPHNKSSLVVVVRESPTDLRDDNVLLSNNTHFLLVYYHHFGDCCSFCKPLFINCCCCRPSMKCRTFSIPHSHTLCGARFGPTTIQKNPRGISSRILGCLSPILVIHRLGQYQCTQCIKLSSQSSTGGAEQYYWWLLL